MGDGYPTQTLVDLIDQSVAGIEESFPGLQNTSELEQRVQDIVPWVKGDYKLQNVIGNITKFKASIACNLSNAADIEKFVDNYNSKNGETLRISSSRAGKKSPYTLIKYYRCHHNTRYQKTMDAADVLSRNPSKRIKNTNCRFSLVIKLLKVPTTTYNALVYIEWNHNHSVTALQTLSFKDIPFEVNLNYEFS